MNSYRSICNKMLQVWGLFYCAGCFKVKYGFKRYCLMKTHKKSHMRKISGQWIHPHIISKSHTRKISGQWIHPYIIPKKYIGKISGHWIHPYIISKNILTTDNKSQVRINILLKDAKFNPITDDPIVPIVTRLYYQWTRLPTCTTVILMCTCTVYL